MAYNPNADEYLVVWDGDDRGGALVNDEFEVYGQRLDARTGAEVGINDFRKSSRFFNPSVSAFACATAASGVGG